MPAGPSVSPPEALLLSHRTGARGWPWGRGPCSEVETGGAVQRAAGAVASRVASRRPAGPAVHPVR